MTDPRDTYRWKVLRKRLVARATSCAICGAALDKRAAPRSRWAPSVDHLLAVASYPHLALEESNLRVVHVGCNSRKGMRTTVPTATSTTTTPATKSGNNFVAATCPIHGARSNPGCHPRWWIIAGCDRHGDQCPDLE